MFKFLKNLFSRKGPAQIRVYSKNSEELVRQLIQEEAEKGNNLKIVPDIDYSLGKKVFSSPDTAPQVVDSSSFAAGKATLSGKPPAPGLEYAGAPQPIDPNTGMHKDYWVLPESERQKGFVRPYCHKYIHVGTFNKRGCNVVTSMGQALSETYARNPKFYGATFCCGCGQHFPVGEFRWVGGEMEGKVVGD